MASYLVLLSLVGACLGTGLKPRSVCNADNCARAVTGTRDGPLVLASHLADCTSFLMVTVTPASIPITTVTVTPTSYSIVGSGAKRDALPDAAQDGYIAPRQVTQTPSSVPTYASACSGAVRYSSACSCAGVTVTTTTVPAPATTTATVTAATTVVPVCDPADNYGANYDYITYAYNVVLIEQYTATRQECCAACFALGSNCFFFISDNVNECALYAGSEMGLITPYCPNGLNQALSLGPDPDYVLGIGPCAIPPPM